MRTSFTWTPFLAYAYFGSLVAAASELAVVAVQLVRNPVFVFWAMFVAVGYFFALLSVLMAVAGIMVALRRADVQRRIRPVVLALPAAVIGGPAATFAVWWPLTFELPPAWLLGSSLSWWGFPTVGMQLDTSDFGNRLLRWPRSEACRCRRPRPPGGSQVFRLRSADHIEGRLMVLHGKGTIAC